MSRRYVYMSCVGTVGLLLVLAIKSSCSQEPQQGNLPIKPQTGSVVKSENAESSISPHTLAQLINILDPWTDDVFSESSYEKAIAVAGLFQELDPRLVILALRERERSTHMPVGNDMDPVLEMSKAYILIRIIFELPEDPRVDDDAYVGGWLGWSADMPPRPVHANTISWPLIWRKGRPEYVAGFAGYSGPTYSPAAEYINMKDKYAYRNLSSTDDSKD